MSSVRFEVECETEWGFCVGLLGSDQALGGWNKKKVQVLSTGKDLYPKWTLDCASVESVENAEYKYVLMKDGNICKWEGDGPNRRITAKPGADGVIVQNDGRLGVSKKAPPQQHHSHQQNGNIPRSESALNLLDAFGSALAREDAKNGSWRQKLAFVRKVFTDEKYAQEVGFDSAKLEHLVLVVVYLSFLKNGQVPCSEDGGHYRPNHHANEARQIEETLRAIENPKNSFVLRKIYPLLPSYSSEFTASVPLTRIRDIAHRSDIPHDLKQEIKHTLQNKLHRCAGPEDLVTCERILDKVTQPGANYSGEFIHQMHIFHRELREFFNASGLEQQLEALRDRKEPADSSADFINRFMKAKGENFAPIDQLAALVELRQELKAHMKELNDGEVLQRVRLADTHLENYAFVLLAQTNQEVERFAGNERWGAHEWGFVLRSLELSLDNVVLSGVSPAECEAMRSETNAMLKSGALGNLSRSDLLRLRAAIERLSRFGDDFSSEISALYLGRVEPLARALGVDKHAADVFAEAEIRANVIFQMSRAVNASLKCIRSMLGLPPWDALLPGTAIGVVRRAARIEDLSESMLEKPCIVILDHAEGDEDIPMAVKGVVLAHDLPHLSHLGVRARQAQCIFVCAEERRVFDELCSNASALESNDKFAELVVSMSGTVELRDHSASSAKGGSSGSASSSLESNLSSVKLPDVSARKVLQMKEISAESCGAKSNAASELFSLANAKARFSAPVSIAIPFGVFNDAQKRSSEYSKRIKAFDALPLSEKETASSELRALVESFEVPKEVLDAIQKSFAKNVRVMVRSSANCEDLETISGAGLYDSISNVDVGDRNKLAQAVRSVWGSLWTKRAALSRSQYRVKHENAMMGVLVQEMVRAEYSFVMFSQNPIDRARENEVYMEIACGMGETLASAASRGSPYRFAVEAENVREIAMANYSVALLPGDGNGASAEHANLVAQTVDYSKRKMTTDKQYREAVVNKLAALARVLEKEQGRAQDIEGAIIGTDVYLVQTRPMVV